LADVPFARGSYLGAETKQETAVISRRPLSRAGIEEREKSRN
jgi:hypothetical protein